MKAFGDLPGRSLSRFVGLTMREDEGPDGALVVHGHAPVPDHLRDAQGNLSAGVLLTMIDSVGGLCGGLAALPGWVVSTSLAVCAGRPATGGPLRLEATVQRTGRRAVVTAVRVHDEGAATVAAEAVLTSAVLEPAGGAPVGDRPVVLAAVPLEGRQPGFDELLGIRIEQGAAVLEVTDTVRNPWGILHGGAVAGLVDVAAHHAGAGVVTGAVVHFLSPNRTGPVAARGDVVGVRGDETVLRVEVVDRGAGRTTAVATMTLSPGP